MESVTLFVIPAASPRRRPTPTGVSAVAGDGRVTLSWNAVSGATSYKVYRGTASGVGRRCFQSGVTATTFLDTGVTNGTTYFYKVSAVNAGGESPLSPGSLGHSAGRRAGRADEPQRDGCLARRRST